MGTHYRHLDLDERVRIEKLVDEGFSLRAVARELGRSPATISREVARNGWRPSSTSQAYTPYRPAGLKTDSWTRWQYRASIAQGKAVDAGAASHVAWKMRDDLLVDYVCEHLRRGWTPQMISGRLRYDYPGEAAMWVCPETLYQWIYSKAQKWRGLSQYLPRGHKKRRKRSGRRVHRGSCIPERVSIHERPSSVEDRSEFGHWEGDSVIGGGHTGGLHTQVERKTRFLMAKKITRVGAKETVDAALSMFTDLPQEARRTLTFDNGSEFTNHKDLANALGARTYFADPYSSWQRGSNEHFNGRIRRYLPKRTPFTEVTDQELTEIVIEINNQPRKCLGWMTSAEAFQEQLESLNHPVALQN